MRSSLTRYRARFLNWQIQKCNYNHVFFLSCACQYMWVHVLAFIQMHLCAQVHTHMCLQAGGWRKCLRVSSNDVYPEVFEKESFIVTEQARLAASGPHRHVCQDYRSTTRSTITPSLSTPPPNPCLLYVGTGGFSCSAQQQAKADF